MNNTLKLSLLACSISFLAGCTGPTVSYSERLSDNFAFTAAQNVSAEGKCFILTKTIPLPSGSVTYTIPAGKYVAKKKNSTGYFYYAPSSIKSTNWLLGNPQEGIYINNAFSHADLFDVNPYGDRSRPLRTLVLPDGVFSYIKKSGC